MAQIPIRGRHTAEIAASVEAAVHAGNFKPSQALPTVRQLAGTLRVSPTTVAAAYQLLQRRGIVAASGRNGTRIASRPPTPAVRSRPRVPDGIVDLATGNPDPELLPPLEHAARALDWMPRLYDEPAVIPALATFVSGEVAADGVPSAAVTLVGGGLDGIERVLREHVRPGDRVAVEDPAFSGVLDLIAANGLIAVPVDIDDEGMLPEALKKALASRARAVIVTPRAQNPTGAAIGEARARDLRRVLGGFPDVLLVEDDHAGPIAGVPLKTLCEAGRPRWAVVRSVSKYLGPDLRVAFVAGDEMTVARVAGRLSVGTRWVSHILQQLVLALWSDPSSGRRLARAAEVYRQRRAAVLAALAARGIAARGASGLNVWIPVREEAHTVQALLERGWAVMPGERFRIASGPAIRVTTAALNAPDSERFSADLAGILAARTGSAA
jgi:DNA-binding transcriptional MocR family regulator